MRGERKFQLTEQRSTQVKLRNALEKGEITNDLVERRNSLVKSFLRPGAQAPGLVSMTMTGWCTFTKVFTVIYMNSFWRTIR